MIGAVSERSWAGTTLEDRRADRRARLLDVGLELVGTSGSAAVTVRSVCRAAGLTNRYFYENFDDRDALLLAVYDEVAAEAEAALSRVVAEAPPDDRERLARAAVEAFLDVVADDPRKGRVLLLEPLTDPVLGTRSVAVSPTFVGIVRAQLGDVDSTAARLTAVALVGAMSSLFQTWLDGSLAVDRPTLADYCVRLLVTAMGLV